MLGPEGLVGWGRLEGAGGSECFLGIKGVGRPGWEVKTVIRKWIFSEPKSVQSVPHPLLWPWAGRVHRFQGS